MEKISWKAHDRIFTEKTNDWYWIVAIITISVAVISIILNNIIFGILILVSSFTLSLVASKKPEYLETTIDHRGVTTGKIFYPYENLESFWIETRDAHPRLIIKSKKILMTYITILLEDMHPEDVRDCVSKYLREEEHTEPFLEKVLIYFGF